MAGRMAFACLQQRASFTPQSALGHSLKRQFFSRPKGIINKNNGGIWKRFFAATKETVRAIPLKQSATRAGWSGDQIGKLVLAGGSAIGLGSLCVYGLGLTGEEGAIDRMGFWSEEVKARVNKTYGFFTYSLAATAGAAFLTIRQSSSSIMRFMIARRGLSAVVFFVGTIGSMICTESIPYSPETLPLKMGLFTLFSGIVGVTLAPLIAMAGPLAIRAAAYTAGVVGGLSLTAMCAPSDKYLRMGGPLSLGLGVVIVASVGSFFAAPGGAVFSGLSSIYMYGGLVLFGGFMLYDTQRIIHHAEKDLKYDPINRSIGIYLDTINIFINILRLMSGSWKRK